MEASLLPQQVEADQMSRFIPVEPEKWGEMVKALSEVKTLQAEIKTLKDQIEQMESHFEDDTKSLADLEAENARLRASSFVTAVPAEEYEKLQKEIVYFNAKVTRLLSQNRLLREAGDDLWYCIRHNDKLGMQEAIEEWKDARHD